MSDKNETGETDSSHGVPVGQVKCHECGAEISAKAEICPKCGVRQSTQVSGKSPIIAAILNLLVVGLGHVYIGHTKRGIVLFVLAIAIAIISFGLGWIFGMFVTSYDAYQLAQGNPGPLDFLEKYLKKI